MSTTDLQTRLSTLQDHIDKAEARLKLKGLFSADHHATSAELKQRHALLSGRLRDEITQAEQHGHHVSNLEASVRQWLDSLEIEID